MRKELRLKRSSEFRKVFKEGKRFLSPHFVLYMQKNESPTSRLGVSIARRHFKLATRRNRLRRVAKESFREDLTPRLKGHDFVIASRRNFAGKNIKEPTEEIRRLLRCEKRLFL